MGHGAESMGRGREGESDEKTGGGRRLKTKAREAGNDLGQLRIANFGLRNVSEL
jgi:hypothetical protein